MPLTDRLLTRAARHWPEDMRADMLAEWHAEAHTIGTDPASGRPARAWRRLRFAASLAAAPPVDEPPGLLGRLREGMPGGTRRLAPFALLALGAVIIPQIVQMLPAYADQWFGHERTPGPDLPPTGGILLTANLIALALAITLGVIAARTAPIARHRPALNALIPIVVSLLTILYMGFDGFGSTYFQTVIFLEHTPLVIATIGAAGLLCAGLVHIAPRHPAIALAVTVAGGLAVLELCGIALSWPELTATGASAGDAAGTLPGVFSTNPWIERGDLPGLGELTGPMVLELTGLMAFALAYAFTAVRAFRREPLSGVSAVPARKEGRYLALGVLPLSVAATAWAFSFPEMDPELSAGVEIFNLRGVGLVLVLLAGFLSIPGGRAVNAGLGITAAMMSTVLFHFSSVYLPVEWRRLVEVIGVLFALLAWSGAVSARRTPLRPWVLWTVPGVLAAAVSGTAEFTWWVEGAYGWKDGIALVLAVVVVQCATSRFRWWHLAVAMLMAPVLRFPLEQVGQALLSPYGHSIYRDLGGLEFGFGGPPVLVGLLLGVALGLTACAVTAAPRRSPGPVR